MWPSQIDITHPLLQVALDFDFPWSFCFDFGRASTSLPSWSFVRPIDRRCARGPEIRALCRRVGSIEFWVIEA